MPRPACSFGLGYSAHGGLQESYYELLKSGGFLSEEEAEVLAWGRNARVTVPPRFKASGSHAVSYKRATAVECLVRPWRSRRASCPPRICVGLGCYLSPARSEASGTLAICQRHCWGAIWCALDACL